ncbi:MAG TPA: M48 family metallopeptidase [Thermodesulfobacteriota bacterium]|nr:M48 family metallopeptidase [Thermodesulfobacteriota bacterium]
MLTGSSKSDWIKKFVITLSILVAFVFLFITCYKAPVTGRSQLILFSQEQVAEMGVAAFQQVLEEEDISHNPEYNQAVRAVGSRIVRVSDTPDSSWDYRVIKDDDMVNAFALPGGKIGVYTGILPVAKTHAGLATVMGHEVAHVAANHGAERMSAGLLAQLGAVGLGVALGNQDPDVLNAVMQAFGLGVNVGALLPFSRAQESEADKIGLIYMARAGYDPRESIAFWSRMEEATKGMPRPPEFLSTHPGYGTRAETLKKWLPRAMYYYERSSKAPNYLIASDVKETKGLKMASGDD